FHVTGVQTCALPICPFLFLHEVAAEHLPDGAPGLRERGLAAYVVVPAGPGEVDVDDGADPARPAGEHEDAVGEADGLVEVVGDRSEERRGGERWRAA